MATIKKKLPKKPQVAESTEYDDRPTLYANEKQVKFPEDPELKEKVTLEVDAELVAISLGDYGENKGKKEYRFRINSISKS